MKTITKEDQARVDELAKQIAKYAFATSFHFGYQNALIQINHCFCNMLVMAKEMEQILLPYMEDMPLGAKVDNI